MELEDSATEEISFWDDIWFSPLKTVAYVIKYDINTKLFYLFIYVSSVIFALNNASSESLGDSFELSTILLLSIFIGGLGGLITHQYYVFILNLSCNWIGGEGTFKSTRIAYSFSFYPSLIAIPIIIFEIILFGNEIFSSHTPSIDNNSISKALFSIFIGSQFIIGVLQLILNLKFVSIAQKIPPYKILFGHVIALVLTFAPFVLLGVLVRFLG
ncbi:MAG: YIP1 family protein [Balneolaceae bacterium]